MSKTFAWLLGLVVLVVIALLVACGTTYNKSSDGLVLVGSQGSALIQTYSFGLSDGHIQAVANSTSSTGNSTCVLPGIPSAMVLDPAGAYAYVILTASTACTGSQTGIAAFKVNSDGTMTAAGSVTPDPNPVAMVMDVAGKFLFVAEGLGGGVNVYAISSGSLTVASSSPALPPTTQAPNLVALAATPTVFPGLLNGTRQAVCTGAPEPAAEYLYAVDSVNYLVWEFAVNTSTGALGLPGSYTEVPSFATDAVPAGVVVDACNRFVYVSGSLNNTVSAYTMCNGSTTQSQTCPATPDGSLVEVSGSPVSLSGGANGPGPMAIDPFGNYLYVVDTLSNQLSTFHLSPVTGSLTASGVVATGSQPKSIAIRSDDMWLFVANYQSATLSQYSITPASGSLNALPATTTDNYPWGVAVK
jgi:6-phosphogluconolactonase (cycloisomerase 2 family)